MHRLQIILAFLAVVAAISAGVWWLGYRSAIVQVADQGAAVLRSASDRLVGQLSRYRLLAVTLADHPDILALAKGEQTPDAIAPLLLKTADFSGALEISFLTPEGAPLASSSAAPATDKTIMDRPRTGALGFSHGVSGTGQRDFAFLAPVHTGGGIAGAVAVRVDMETVEESDWRGVPQVVLFTDEEGQIFISNRSELLFRSFMPGVPGAGFGPDHAWTLRGLTLWATSESRYVPDRAVYGTLPLPVIGMTGHSLISTQPAERIALLQAAVTAALCLAFGAILFWATERRRTLALANTRLEHRVAERTEELTRANTQLRQEVSERLEAEKALRRAQADLVQAGKLSALGQMSAGISHELNQPLMAIQSFSENAQLFMDKDKPEEARANLGRIAELSRRMGRIIKNLRAFARQETEPMTRVDIGAVIDAVLELAETRLRRDGVQVEYTPPAAPVYVRGGEVRLQQVLMNLMTNALDAMTGREAKRIELNVARDGGDVLVSLRDTGPGLDDPEKIFDPFYTTKEVGQSEGMGLGLSISYGLVQSFGGDITGRNHPEGGAVFRIRLASAPVEEVAA
ncbi:sensor histidine kinase [Roseovarius faecimaris]|uniref:C4-dicarboxylate transport sensor protein DctB n=1 Tax=Roseovarius faecimaris TaxID=2494550 RepID=A0A6I6ILS7_9RHOB|nr:ATP-binding protein [Roseovarius faecimaris]QGX96811.1 sensor histidine kinase [Roseovarius faecimaris]